MLGGVYVKEELISQPRGSVPARCRSACKQLSAFTDLDSARVTMVTRANCEVAQSLARKTAISMLEEDLRPAVLSCPTPSVSCRSMRPTTGSSAISGHRLDVVAGRAPLSESVA